MKKTKFHMAFVATSLLVQPVCYGQADGMIEEVVVTARKRTESLQDVPMAVSAFGASRLEDAQVENITDLERMTPNITLSETGGVVAGSLSAFIRGIGNDPGFDQGVGIYIDDVYLNSATGSLLEVYDIERIEVLKGPQGHLYGRNTIGGAIKYITKEPANEFEANIGGKIGSYDKRQVKAGISGPLVDGLLLGSFGVMYETRDGIQENISTGKDYWSKDVQAYRGTLVWTPADNHKLKFTVDYSDDQSDPVLSKRVAVNQGTLNGISFVITGANPFLGGTGLTSIPNNAEILRDEDAVNTEIDDAFDDFRIKSSTFSLTYLWDLSDRWSFKSVSAYRRVESDVAFDYDGTDQSFITTVRSRDNKDFSQEFQFNYSSDRLNGVFGVYYLNGEEDNKPYTEQFARLRAVQSIKADTQKDLRKIESISTYAAVDWDFAESWQLSLGGRYTQDKKSLEQFTVNENTFYALAALQGFPPSAIVAVRPGAESTAEAQPLFAGWVTPFTRAIETVSINQHDVDDSWNEFTPSVKLSYRVHDDLMIYTGVSSGFKSGGFQVTGGRSTPYEPETVRSYTLGIKSSHFDRRLTANLEVFYNDYKDKQLSTIVLSNGSLDQTVDNVGKMESSGVELEISASPGQGWFLAWNAGYLDTDVKSYETFNNAGDPVDIADSTAIGFSPRWTVQAQVQKEFDWEENGRLTVGADVSYRSQSYVNSPIDETSSFSESQVQKEHATWNASVAWSSADERYRVALEGKNLSDERVLVNSFVVGPFVNAAYNMPRSWSLSASYQY